MPTAPLCVRQGKPGWRGAEAATVAYHCRKYTLATPNYGYEKRQRELAKKQKKEDKLRARAATARRGAGDDGAEQSPNPPATQDGQAPNAANP